MGVLAMTLEEKQLLLKDLCARLPYGVIVDYRENEFEIPHWKITTIYPETLSGWIGYDKKVGAGSESGSRPFNIGEVKPYLRPMSSMSEKEKDELALIGDKDFQSVREWYNAEYMNETGTPCPVTSGKVDYCNKNHLDYRGLIPMGLALEAPEGMYKNE